MLLALYISIFAPGKMDIDAGGIYEHALAHQYADHHPPLMAYMWHYLNFIYQGPLLMFLINMALLWGALYMLAFKIFNNQRVLQYFTILIPFMPQIAVHGRIIGKDVIFTFGYGFLAMFLAYLTIHNKKISLIQMLCFLITVVYFTAVKFQAQFILPILLLWLFYTLLRHATCAYKKSMAIIASAITSFSIMTMIDSINHHLVTEKGSGSNHSWQYVKIFDLSGMSIYSNQVLLPQFLLKHPKISVEDIQKKYQIAWEPLIVYEDSPLRGTKDEHERELLLQTWWKEVFNHPVSYIQHRGKLWFREFFLASCAKGWLEEIGITGLSPLQKALRLFATLAAFIFLFPFQIMFFSIGKRALNFTETKHYATALLFLSSMGCALLALLFVKSLAVTVRYIFFTFYMFFLSCPFAYHCFLELKQKKLQPATDQL
ncbi:MAG: hypothetical protein COY39_05950 [Alphaproteobacteria bacterium CG_4_10_14_0_8_um_filter_37_21]|nr:MAG: hypothetical protein COY39_05950 [Alphaproteobacteria bacterium CG_4_10_14_0_8_um_filter_37_21]